MAANRDCLGDGDKVIGLCNKMMTSLESTQFSVLCQN